MREARAVKYKHKINHFMTLFFCLVEHEKESEHKIFFLLFSQLDKVRDESRDVVFFQIILKDLNLLQTFLSILTYR